ncbi:FAD-dependent monooxygenase [Amycolatopsis sp. NPDC059021]|uniref:FAD-dependent monooxygenase n=1 Tax=Amycolatopsis sp. NPDC059021 TaxID=3346704 RepID=UPI00366DE2CE
METTVTDVLVVGAGPTGLVASALLAKYGIDSVTVTKHEDTALSPRAHIVNQRSVEIFRELGVEDEVMRVGTPIRALGNNVWATSFAGPELARLRAWGTGPERRGEYLAASPCELVNAPQHLLEPVLLSGARKAGADIRFGHELGEFTEYPDHVLATVRDHGEGTEYRVQARYVIGADGGRSLTAKQAGIGYEDESGVLNWAANVWLEADLTEYCAHRPAALYWIYRPGDGFHCTTWICVRPWTEWVMAVVFPEQHEEPPVLDHETALAYARGMIGDPAVDVRVKSVNTWSVGQALAGEFRKGRVLLAGDSAHRHPPPNGLGSNTGMQDAHNLAWKLAMVVQGHAGDELLDSYHTERKETGRVVVDSVMRSLRNLTPLAEAFGFAPGRSEEETWARIAELSADTTRGRERRRELREAVELQHHQYNCHGVECGLPYTGGALVHDDGLPPREPSAGERLRFRASTRPGSPVPHAWLEHLGTPLSTVDVVGNGVFTLVTGIGGQPWVRAADQVARALGTPITTAVVGYQQQYHDVYGHWAALREIDDTGCLLVRPDRYVAWRRHRLTADPAGDLAVAVKTVLGKEDDGRR